MKQSDVLKAIKGSGGVMSTIAKRLDCAWYTARKYVNEWEATRQAYEDEEQMILDLAESKIYESINNGNTQDAKWLLATKGKKRGFTEKQEVEHTGIPEITIKVVNAND
jgi:hypothetical protein